MLLKARRQDTVIHEELARVRGRGTILLAAEISRPRSKILPSRPLALDLQPSQKNEKRAIRKTSLVVFDVHATDPRSLDGVQAALSPWGGADLKHSASKHAYYPLVEKINPPARGPKKKNQGKSGQWQGGKKK